MKKHFTDESWFDFVRRLLPPAQSQVMQLHLDDGCEKCNTLHDTWKAVVETMIREVQYEPGEPAVRVAKAAYASARPKYLVPMLAKMIPLVFDSFVDKSASAVRGQIHASPRHLLHRTRSWAVDLRLEHGGGGQMSVAGQVLRSGRKSTEAVVADVILMQGDTLLARTSTNQFGEFQLQCPDEKNLHIYLDIVGRQPLAIALPDSDT